MVDRFLDSYPIAVQSLPFQRTDVAASSCSPFALFATSGFILLPASFVVVSRTSGNGFKVGIWLIDNSNLANKIIVWSSTQRPVVSSGAALQFSVDGSIVLLHNTNGEKHHPHKALSTGSPIPSPTHSPSIFYQTLLFPLLHNSSMEPLLAPTGELVPWPSSCPPFRVNEDITRLNVYLISVAQNRMYHSILKAFRVENNKDVKWYVMADDDTLIFVDNLVELLGKYDHTKYYYIGTNSESIH
ncbi:hypothetical protein WN943_029654 [Citrus x changshan-huyou]